MKNDNKIEKKIPLKNYIILGIICVVTFILVFYLVDIYKNRVKYNNENKNVMSFLSEIKEEELNNYISENHDTMIYISSTDDVQNRKYETKLKKYVTKKNLTKNMVYLNVTDLDVDFLNYLKNNYFNDELKGAYTNVITVPNVFIIRDERIVKVLNKEKSQLDINKTKSFIEKYWIEQQ